MKEFEERGDACWEWLWDMMLRDKMLKREKSEKEKKYAHRSWTPQFFGLRTLASLVSANGIFRKLFCRRYVCIQQDVVDRVQYCWSHTRGLGKVAVALISKAE